MAKRIIKEVLEDGKHVVGRERTVFVVGENPIKIAMALERVQTSDRPNSFVEDSSVIEKYISEPLSNYRIYTNGSYIVGLNHRVKNHEGILNYLEPLLTV